MKLEKTKYDNMWYEDLPKQCPPDDAFNPNGMILYRLAVSEIPTNNDFLSQRYLNPDRIFNNVSECLARSISTLNDIDACKNMIKLPRYRKRFKSIFELKLDEKDGVIKQTFKKSEHFSWWRSNLFNFENPKKVRVLK